MSNEFVSVPRDLLERIYEKIWPVHGVSKELRSLLDAPAGSADKAQGEPVAWVQGFPRTGHFPAKLQEDRKNGYTIPLYAEQPAPGSGGDG